MGLGDDLLSLLEPSKDKPVAASKPLPAIPTPRDWAPGVTRDANGGEIATGPLKGDPDWDEIFKIWNLDPLVWEVIDGSIEVRAWDAAVGEGVTERLYHYKAKFRRRNEDKYDTVEANKILDFITSKKPTVLPKIVSGPESLCVFLADWQLGKEGTEDAIAGLKLLGPKIVERAEELRERGLKVSKLFVAGMGDLSEGCSDFYEHQQFTVILNRRDQIKAVRRVLANILVHVAPHFEEIVVAPIAGNHGENRKNFRLVTDDADNDDVAVFEQVADIFSNVPEYSHIKFWIPEGELTVCYEISGTRIGLTHGHLSRGGKHPAGTLWDWWKSQTFGAHPTSSADILVCGHYHHLEIKQESGRTLFICPSMEHDSKYFRERWGVSSDPGTLTFVVNDGKWSRLEIL